MQALIPLLDAFIRSLSTCTAANDGRGAFSHRTIRTPGKLGRASLAPQSSLGSDLNIDTMTVRMMMIRNITEFCSVHFVFTNSGNRFREFAPRATGSEKKGGTAAPPWVPVECVLRARRHEDVRKRVGNQITKSKSAYTHPPFSAYVQNHKQNWNTIPIPSTQYPGPIHRHPTTTPAPVLILQHRALEIAAQRTTTSVPKSQNQRIPTSAVPRQVLSKVHLDARILDPQWTPDNAPSHAHLQNLAAPLTERPLNRGWDPGTQPIPAHSGRETRRRSQNESETRGRFDDGFRDLELAPRFCVGAGGLARFILVAASVDRAICIGDSRAEEWDSENMSAAREMEGKKLFVARVVLLSNEQSSPNNPGYEIHITVDSSDHDETKLTRHTCTRKE
ncbi:hypothetical protein CONPUDRAFT_73768 [Coniophora puteana RWD-64-598 SS2]|uniref:Uncharacterized protein n=1 Tax=Coniophora puteana (strain RWD-64-598) TaxID=741705 RepID=A0A5M3MPU6_CONPW|nr:uncharacterized protein CONPUDRAFT_73768 [Coniophora puteana RWD-64-598 SS2]EIW80705.1 hypothetical protein CONPUDRAFT_73768 [Coniophora puteana RWD-64-598 SS2]